MKWIVIFLNLAAILALFSVRQYAHGYHRSETKWAYQAFVSRGSLDETKAEEYARTHNGWHQKTQLESIGNPDGFVQIVFVMGVAAIILNSIALFSCRAAGRQIAEPS